MSVERFDIRSERNQDDLWSVYWITDRRGNIRGGLWDIIWEKWQQGEIPGTWGEQELVVAPPEGWNWHIDDPDHPKVVTVTLKVIGFVLTATGEAHRHLLHDILEQKYDRAPHPDDISRQPRVHQANGGGERGGVRGRDSTWRDRQHRL